MGWYKDNKILYKQALKLNQKRTSNERYLVVWWDLRVSFV